MSERNFVEWLRRNDPAFLNYAVRVHQQREYGLGAAAMPVTQAVAASKSSGFSVSGLLDTVKDLASTYYGARAVKEQAKMQTKLIDENISRSRMGLEPLDSMQIAPGVRVGLEAPQLSGMGWLPWAGLGVMALILVMNMGKGGRR